MLQNIRPNAVFFLATSLFLVFSVILSLAAFATGGGDKNSALTKTVMLNGSCQRVEIFGDIEIVLSPTMSDRIILEGTATDVNIIGTKFKKGTLYVRAQWVNSAETTKVIVPAAMLKFVAVNGNTVVSSAGSLNVPKLLVVVNGESEVKIRSYGQVNVEAADGYYLTNGPSGYTSSSSRIRTLTRADYFYMDNARVAGQ